VADGGGHSPQTISGSTCFQDKVPQRSTSPSIKWLSRRESHSRPLPSQGSALVLLSYGIMVEDYGISPYSTGCRPVVSYSVTDPPNCTLARTLIWTSGFRRAALCFKLRGHKVDSCVGLAPTNDRLQPAASASLAYRRVWCGALVTLQVGVMLDCFYRQPRLFTELSPQDWLQGRDSNLRMPGYEPGDLGLLSTLRSLKWSHRSDSHRCIALYKSAPVATEGSVAKVVRLVHRIINTCHTTQFTRVR
jgi:hypothetical protein